MKNASMALCGFVAMEDNGISFTDIPSNRPGIPWTVQGFELLSRVQGMGPFVQGLLILKIAKG